MPLASPRFVGCAGGGGGGGGIPAELRTAVALAGAIDGANVVFTAPHLFVHDGVTDEAVYLRGKRLLHGVGNDYTVSESGGPGSGYDTITLAQAPKAGDNLLADYYIDT